MGTFSKTFSPGTVQFGSKVNQNEPEISFNLVIEGHSFVAPNAAYYPSNGLPGIPNTSTFYNSAVGSSGVATMGTRGAVVDSKLVPEVNGVKNELVIWIGVNDIVETAGQGLTAYNLLITYVQNRITAGWKKIRIFTITPSTFGGRGAQFEIERGVFNSNLKNDLAATYPEVKILDTDTIAVLSDANNTTYYVDKLHISFLGGYLACELYRSSIVADYGVDALQKVPSVNEISLPLTPTGTGAGVATITMRSSEKTVVSLTGTGKFYANIAGTVGESDLWVLYPGLDNQIYLKAPSGTVNLNIDKNKVTSWSNWTSPANAPSIGGNIGDLSAITYWSIFGANTLGGNINTLNPATTRLLIRGSNTLSGNISDIPSTMTYLSLDGLHTLTGSISSLPADLTILYLEGTIHTVSFNLSALGSKITNIIITGQNVVTGNISDIPASVAYFVIEGQNTITGDLADLKNALTYISIYGKNTIQTYTQGKDWTDSMNYFRLLSATGLDSTELANLIIDLDTNSTWSGSSRTLNLGWPNVAMGDTSQGGRWGDFSGTASPSNLAVAYKSLRKSKSVTITMNGVVAPVATGDGTGFPAGFGDWYRT
jgi:hypothetical protein